MRKNIINSILSFFIILCVLLSGCTDTKNNEFIEGADSSNYKGQFTTDLKDGEFKYFYINDYEYDENDVIEIQNYLDNNNSQLEIEDLSNIEDLKLLDSDLEKHQIFLIAEEHGVRENYLLKKKFFKYFKEKADIKYIIEEIPYSFGQIVNQYLESGNEDRLVKLFEGTMYGCEGNRDFWKYIYEYNKKLPEDEKIQVIGIDIEHQPAVCLSYMKSLIEERQNMVDTPKEIDSIINKIIYLAENKGKKSDILEIIESIKFGLENNYDAFDIFFGNKMFDFEMSYKGIKDWKIKNGNFTQLREEKMYENFKELYKKLPEGKYFGQFGSLHTCTEPAAGFDWVFSKIDENIPNLSGRIMPIVILYDNCQVMSITGRVLGTLNNFTNENHFLKKFLHTKYKIFKLNGENSPFDKNMIWLINHEFLLGGPYPIEKPTTEYYKYIIVLRNGKASEKLRND